MSLQYVGKLVSGLRTYGTRCTILALELGQVCNSIAGTVDLKRHEAQCCKVAGQDTVYRNLERKHAGGACCEGFRRLVVKVRPYKKKHLASR